MTDQTKEIGIAVVSVLTVLFILGHIADVMPSLSGFITTIAVMMLAAFAVLLSGQDIPLP